MNASNTPGSPERTVQRLNQAIVDLTGDSYFHSHPFFFVLDGYVDVRNAIRLAEVLEGATRVASIEHKVEEARTKPDYEQLRFNFGPDFHG
jgi:hypothetical protein